MTNAAYMVPTGHENAVTREDLVRLTGETDRQVREDLRQASVEGDLIINLQDGKGYFRPNPIDDVSLVKNWIAMAESRIREESKKIRIANRFVQE